MKVIIFRFGLFNLIVKGFRVNGFVRLVLRKVVVKLSWVCVEIVVCFYNFLLYIGISFFFLVL